MRLDVGFAVLLWTAAAFGQPTATPTDVHSYARPDHVRVRHVDLDLHVDFERERLHGRVTLTVERVSNDASQPLVLDSRKLQIDRVEASADGKDFRAARFEVGRE